MQMKSNKNGVKLLAAVMVFAMAFAGIFVAISGEESDAAAPKSNPFEGLTEGTATYDAGVYTLAGNVTITLKKDLIVNDVKFVLGGYELTITSTDTTKPNTLTMNYTASAEKEVVFTNGTLTVSNANLNITLSAADSVKDKEAGLHILDVKMILNINGKSTVTFTQSADAKGQTIAEGSEVNIDKADAKLVLSGCNTVAATTINMDASKLEVKNPNATGLSVYLNMSDGAEIKLTGATATKGDIKLYKSSVENSTITTDGAIKFYNGSAIDQTYTMTESTITAKTFGYWAGEAGQTVALTGGTYNGDITLDGKYSYKFVSATYNGTITNVNGTETSVATFTNLVSNTDGITISQGSIKIDGVPQTATNGKIVVSSGKLAIAETGTIIPADVTLIVEEGAKVTGGDIINNGIIEVYGELESDVDNDSGKMVIAPTSNVSGSVSGGSIVQDAEMSKPFYIGGELEKSMEIGNATLNDNLHIPEGKVLTVDGDLFLSGNAIVVDGELVITKNGCIYEIGGKNGAIVISKGTISNNGIIGNAMAVTVAYDEDITNLEDAKPIVSMQGVAGVNFTVKKIDGSNAVIVSGDITRISAVEKNEITIHTNAIIGDLTIAKKVTLIVNAVSTAANSTIIIDGKIAASGEMEITLGSASTFVMNGSSDGNVTVVAQTGKVGDNGKITGTVGEVEVKPGNNVTGFTIYTKKVAVAEKSTTNYYMRAYINGTLDKIGTPDHDNADVSKRTSEIVTITGEFYVAADETITVSKDAAIDGTGSKANISGSIVIAESELSPSGVLGNNYVGAYYEITTGTAPNTATTLYYTTFSAAIAIIGDVDDKEIKSTVDKVEADFTVKADESVAFVGATVASKATVTVETDGSVTGIKVVEGMVVVKDGATCTIPTAGYAAKSVSADNTITYAGLKVAIENAVEGDVIVISSGETTESLTIPAGVTVTVNNDLKVGGDLTVSEGASLIIKGSLTMTNTTKDVTTQVIGTLDVSDGTYDQGTKSTLKSTGAAVFSNTVDPTTLKFSGAYYTDANSNVVITTVAKAVDGAFAAAQTNVNVKGTVNESGEITLKDMNITLIPGAIVKLGTITLDGKASVIATGATLTATIVGMNGDGDKAVSSSVKVSESNVTVAHEQIVKADDSVSHTFTVSGVNGTVTIASGNVKFASGVEIDGSKNKLVVSEGATLTLDNDLAVNGGVIIIDGTVDVVGKKLTLNNDKAEINGTVNVTKNGEVILQNALVNGTIDVKTEKDKTNKLTISTDKFAFGKPIESIGASAVIIGNVDISAIGSIVAYPGVDLSQAVFNADIDGKSTAVTTTYTINGVEYATVYALVNNAVEVDDIFTLEQVKKVAGLDFTGITALTWKDVQGETVNTAKIGEVDTVGIDVPVAKKKITVSVGTGISLYIDGVKYASGSEPSLTVGEHKVTATVNPGYKGTVDIMVNGVKITNGVFTVALDVDTVVSATGNITIDSGETPVTPVQPTEKDDGMGITDYLLIVLVVLAAILVVIVAIRMMRS